MNRPHPICFAFLFTVIYFQKLQSLCLAIFTYEIVWCINLYSIIQEGDGYFFCLEDRALLCRKCDVAIHTVNSLVSSHQRFLLTGVKIGLETSSDLVSSSSVKSLPCEKIPESLSLPKSTNTQYNKVLREDFSYPKLTYGGGSPAEVIQQWQFDEFFGLTDPNQNYDYINNTSSNKVKHMNFLYRFKMQ